MCLLVVFTNFLDFRKVTSSSAFLWSLSLIGGCKLSVCSSSRVFHSLYLSAIMDVGGLFLAGSTPVLGEKTVLGIGVLEDV